MRRKTNLFYITGTDSEFLTFSNYTDAMTGNFLALDVKLFPSKFLCLDIPSLTYDARDIFIKQLAAYYENKTAFMHDACIDNKYDAEKKMKPLGWLMDFITYYDSYTSVSFVGQVTEQDYNGIYADTICIIDSLDCTYANIIKEDREDTSYEDYSYMSSSYLYGWYDKIGGAERYTGPSYYSEVKPMTDAKDVYYYEPETSYLEIIQPDEQRNIKFNVVIPLFDIINVDNNENDDVIQSMDTIDCRASYASIINVPYGIWFAKDYVELNRDGTKWSPAWSLAIGSQFKPFPYSETPINEVDQAARSSAFMTFSQALIRQNKLLSKMSEVSSQIMQLSNRVTAIEAAVRDIGTSYNIDTLNASMAGFTSYVGSCLSYMQNEIDTFIYNK